MGCDMHSYIEKKNKEGIWKATSGPNPRIQDYHYYAQVALKRGELEKAAEYEKTANDIEAGHLAKLADTWQRETPKVYRDWAFSGRNYSLFALLADVRNNNDITPISMPKGLPVDVSSMVRKDSDGWGYDGHSHTWFTLAEMKGYDTDQNFTRSGWVDEKVYTQWVSGGDPYPHSGSVGGGRIEKVSNGVMDQVIYGRVDRIPDKQYYTFITWNEAISDATGLNKIIESLTPLSKDGIGEDVRLVCWFDN